jgi:glycine/D-amino acid oxidase-like deaminating enzyme
VAGSDKPAAVVVGGGIAGLTAAAALAGAGAAVILLEQGWLASAASGRNTGTLLHQAEPEVEAMLAASVTAYDELSGGPVDFGMRRHDQLLLARDEEQLRTAEGRYRQLSAAGVTAELLSGDDVARAFPFLAPTTGGLLVGEAHVLEPEAVVHAFASCARRAGARICTGTRVVQVIVEGGRAVGVLTDRGAVAADVVILANGPWLAELLPGAPIGAGRGWLLRTERLPVQLDTILEELSWPGQEVLGQAGTPRPLRDLADARPDPPLADAVLICPQRDAGALIGAAMTLSLFDPPEGSDLPTRIATRALQVAPGLAGLGLTRAWSGLRPTAPDGLPVVGPVPGVDGLYLHAGHASLGMQAAPATATWLADAIVGRLAAETLARLAPGRFNGWQLTLSRTRLEAQ